MNRQIYILRNRQVEEPADVRLNRPKYVSTDMQVQWTPLYSTPHAVDSRHHQQKSKSPSFFCLFLCYCPPSIIDVAYFGNSHFTTHIFSPVTVFSPLFLEVRGKKNEEEEEQNFFFYCQEKQRDDTDITVPAPPTIQNTNYYYSATV